MSILLRIGLERAGDPRTIVFDAQTVPNEDGEHRFGAPRTLRELRRGIPDWAEDGAVVTPGSQPKGRIFYRVWEHRLEPCLKVYGLTQEKYLKLCEDAYKKLNDMCRSGELKLW